MKMKNRYGYVFLLFVLLYPALCMAETDHFILLSTTIGPIDSGIVDVLETQFEKETGIRVRHVGAGTSAALKIAEKGDVDIVMAHAKSVEEEFVKAEFGTERVPLMYNDFVILGPSNDPAGIQQIKTAAEALKIIAEKKVPFVTRGDKSGTHLAELKIWELSGTKPSGDWYIVYEKGAEGNAPTLRFADEKMAYVFIDRASYLSLKDQIKLKVLLENDKALLNYITLIPVNPKKMSKGQLY